jgi:quinol monooxygenase YgiN
VQSVKLRWRGVPAPPRAGGYMSDVPITLINVFTVEPVHQEELVELLARATETSVRHAPGFLSARLHRSLDGTKVTMYAEWLNREAYQAMREDPGPRSYFERALAIAKFEPGIYEVVQTFLPEAHG